MLAKLRIPLIALLGLFIFVSVASAATSRVELTDGTVLVGEVRKIGSSYSITMADGSKKLVSAKQIKTIDGKALDAAPPAGASGAGTAGGADKPAADAGKTGTAAFAGTKSKADRVTTPIAAVVLWEKFIETFPKSPDIEAAKAELAIWQKRDADKAEKVKGQWVGGKELEALKKEIDKLVAEGLQAEQDQQFNVAQKKYESALAKYPTHFIANFRLGYFSLVNSNGRPDRLDAAIKHLEIARTVDASGPEVWANLSCAYSFRRRYVESIVAADKALKIFTDPELVAQLVAAVQSAPRNIYSSNPKIREIIDNNGMNLSGVGADGGGWKYFHPGHFDAKRAGSGKSPIQGDDKSRVGVLGNGSGFFITADGYAITNKHVVTDDEMKPDPTVVFRVRLDDGKEYPARVIAIDDKYDVALIKVEPPKGEKFPFLRIAEDNPNPAAQALVLGYPATFDGRYSMQVTSGDVKSIQPEGEDYEVWFNLSTTQGNSGGPIIDRAGRVIGILSAGARSHASAISVVYVLGIGPNQIERFLGRIAEKAPKIVYEPAPSEGTQFNAERLASEHRKATLLILIIRPEAGKNQDGDGSANDKSGGDKPGEEKPGDDKPDSKSGGDKSGDATPAPAP